MKIDLNGMMGACEKVNAFLARAAECKADGDADGAIVMRLAALEHLYFAIGALVGLRGELQSRHQRDIIDRCSSNRNALMSLNAKLDLRQVSPDRPRTEVIGAFLQGFEDARSGRIDQARTDEGYRRGLEMARASSDASR